MLASGPVVVVAEVRPECTPQYVRLLQGQKAVEVASSW